MVIEIKQRDRAKGIYEIYVDSEKQYTSINDANVNYSDVRLFDLTGNCLSVLRNFSTPLRKCYEIRLSNGDTMAYQTVSWRCHYRCHHNSDIYDVYGHFGYKYSIYKNDIQIGWWDNLATTEIEKDRIRIIANNDCKPEIIIVICLASTNQVRQWWGSNNLSIDIGNVIPGKKKFNNQWRPS